VVLKNQRSIAEYVVGADGRAQFSTIEDALCCALDDKEFEECINIFLLPNSVDDSRDPIPYQLPSLLKAKKRRINFIANNFGACNCVYVTGSTTSFGSKCWYGVTFIGSDSTYTLSDEISHTNCSDLFCKCEFTQNFKVLVDDDAAYFINCDFLYLSVTRDRLLEIARGNGTVFCHCCRFFLCRDAGTDAISFFYTQANLQAAINNLRFSYFKDCTFELLIRGNTQYVLMDIRNQQILDVVGCDFYVVTAPTKPTTLYMFGRSRNEQLSVIELENPAAYNLHLTIANCTFTSIDNQNSDVVSVLGDLWNIDPATDTLWFTFSSVQSMKLMNFVHPPEILQKSIQYANLTHIQYSYNGGPNAITSPIEIVLDYGICLVLSIQHVYSTFITPNSAPVPNFPFLDVKRNDDDSRIDVEIGHTTLKNNNAAARPCVPYGAQGAPALDLEEGPPWANFNNLTDFAAQIFYVAVGRQYYAAAISDDNNIGKNALPVTV